MILAVGPKVNEADLGNGYYPHLRKVGAADPEFLDVLAWLRSNGIPWHVRIFTPKGTDPAGFVTLMPDEIHWTKGDAGDTAGRPDLPEKGIKILEAALVFNFPHVALEELLEFYGLPKNTTHQMYPGPRKAVATIDQSPIGEAWPDRPGDFRPSAYDQANPLPYGTVWTDGTGSYVREKRGWAFVGYAAWKKVA